MKKSGFTLIELIFVIVIIGLLASVAVPKFLATKKNAETANLPEIAKQITNKATELYTFIGERDLSKLAKTNRDINITLEHFADSARFNINYDYDDINITYDINSTDKSVCMAIHALPVDVNISPKATVKSYEFNITELNLTCNQELE